ncbi:MAG: Integral membrane protein [Candidatus Uhrbacteria bacterium GW2011_GWE2_45_35]|uniref:Integral membrane protein n=2 Tax=Candidatus Uhriibacteriota TaxID=1752732 RepID=A0A0G1J9R8_9BACT|nr:MAG: Integral membrane protein [Candidatus Uhrbacteria bacterium GW2011_GWF2_44_350]KKU07787.1 MAG: Integral membrane protein [Candidatus Uhrbacteria bacterium GW2011_GWE2_45_35]HBR81044.1 hypothetical protein [Candidatus Uhrbacteria bacterium]HCU32058.1 hypothetical protein [Candidatus Uhrbacteria bacterium]
MGIFFAFLALFSWGIGDFLIQRSTRRFGDGLAMFFVTAFGSIALLPFVFREMGFLLDPINLAILFFTSAILLFAGLLDFEALRVGKIAVVEPIYAIEIPVTAALSWLLINERLNFFQFLLIFLVVLGIVLVSVKNFKHFKRAHLERGVWIAVVANLCMGAANFLVGVSARETSPLFINWFIDVFVAVAMIGYLMHSGRAGKIVQVWKKEKRLILAVSFFDNLAWVAYAAATIFIPIAIAIGISESYIALAVVLGLIFNKEKLVWHQKIGLIITVLAAVSLACFSKF